MENTVDIDYNSNNYFFLTNYSDVFKAGKNSFIVNPTQYIVPNTSIEVSVFDSKGNLLPCGPIRPTNAKFPEETTTGQYYYVTVDSETNSGFGRIEIKGIGLYALGYTGSVAYYKNYAYKVEPSQRLPLLQPVSGAFIPKASVTWTRNVLIDTTSPTDSEIRFFDRPEISVSSEIYSCPSYPTASYVLSSGSFSAVAVNPKNNYDGDYDYQFDSPLYQIYLDAGSKFSSSM